MGYCHEESNVQHNIINVALLNVPERAYRYNEYHDGLVSDDFENT